MIVLRGTNQAVKNAAKMQLRMTKATAAGVYALAARTMTEAKKRAPVDTTALRKSGFATVPDQTATHPESTIGFGGRAEDYAIVQHEDITLNHPNGGEAKFLENAINATSAGAKAFLTKEIGSAFDDNRGVKRDPEVPTNPFADGP